MTKHREPIIDMNPRVFTIPASAPFLPTLIEALRSGKLGFAKLGSAMAGDPLALASATLYLPTRRACRLMRDAFLEGIRRHGSAAHHSDRRHRRRRDRVRGSRHRQHCGRGAGLAGCARRLGAAAPAHPVRHQMGVVVRTARHERHTARCSNTGVGLRACRRSGAPDRRHDHARRVMGSARRPRARQVRPILAADAAIFADCTQILAASIARSRMHRTGRAARPPDQGRNRAP